MKFVACTVTVNRCVSQLFRNPSALTVKNVSPVDVILRSLTLSLCCTSVATGDKIGSVPSLQFVSGSIHALTLLSLDAEITVVPLAKCAANDQSLWP